jgi:hypothetical protein
MTRYYEAAKLSVTNFIPSLLSACEDPHVGLYSEKTAVDFHHLLVAVLTFYAHRLSKLFELIKGSKPEGVIANCVRTVMVCARVLCRIMASSAFKAHLERLHSLGLLRLPHDGWSAHIRSTAEKFGIDLESSSQWKAVAEAQELEIKEAQELMWETWTEDELTMVDVVHRLLRKFIIHFFAATILESYCAGLPKETEHKVGISLMVKAPSDEYRYKWPLGLNEIESDNKSGEKGIF